ncbi:MAG: hypothetical protein AAF627_12230 [Myxococcota bacterium]
MKLSCASTVRPRPPFHANVSPVMDELGDVPASQQLGRLRELEAPERLFRPLEDVESRLADCALTL